MDFDPHSRIPEWEKQVIVKYFDQETNFMAANGYAVEERARKIALSVILQNYSSENYDTLVPYLAMNYFDQYMSRHNLPRIKLDWINDLNLLAIACLSLACRLRNDLFKLSEFLEKKPICLTKENILMAEIRVLIGLDWRMRSITAFSFAHYLFDVCRPPRGLQMETFTRIIVETQEDIRFTAFKPSVISASALLAAFWYLHRQSYQVYEDRLKNLRYLDKTELNQCVALVRDMCANKELLLETADLEIYEGPRTQVQVREKGKRKSKRQYRKCR